MIKDWKENKYITLFLVIGVVFLFLRFLVPIFLPIIIAILISAICKIPLDIIEHRMHLKKQYTMTILLVILISLFWGIAFVFMKSLQGGLAYGIGHWELIEENFMDILEKCCQTIELYIGVDAIYIEGVVMENSVLLFNEFRANTIPSILQIGMNYIGIIGGSITFLLMLFISIILLAKDYDEILNKVQSIEEISLVIIVAKKVGVYLITFLKAQMIIIFSIAIVASIVLWSMNIEYGIFLGIAAGLLDALPFIGTGIVIIPIALWQLINGYMGRAIVCLFLYGICILIRECLEPRLIGKKMGVYPVAIVVAIYAGLQLFGISGLVKGPLGLIICHQLYQSIENLKVPK